MTDFVRIFVKPFLSSQRQQRNNCTYRYHWRLDASVWHLRESGHFFQSSPSNPSCVRIRAGYYIQTENCNPTFISGSNMWSRTHIDILFFNVWYVLACSLTYLLIRTEPHVTECVLYINVLWGVIVIYWIPGYSLLLFIGIYCLDSVI